jgi:hypothetical protein
MVEIAMNAEASATDSKATFDGRLLNDGMRHSIKVVAGT